MSTQSEKGVEVNSESKLDALDNDGTKNTCQDDNFSKSVEKQSAKELKEEVKVEEQGEEQGFKIDIMS